MEDRLTRLEARLKKLENQLFQVMEKLGMAEKKKAGRLDPDSDAGRLEKACKEMGVSGQKVKIHELKKKLGWETERFFSAIEALASEGRAELHQSEGMGLNLRQMEDSYIGENGEFFSELSLVD